MFGCSAVAFEEEELLPLSALQHMVFCPRQCALIHLEQQWVENSLTAQGRQLHRGVDQAGRRRERRGDLLVYRGLAIRSFSLGVSGKADVVEFRLIRKAHAGEGARLHGEVGRWQAMPVEYKRGRPKHNDCDRVQLCAQAMCLEEMLGVTVARGSLFYGEPQKRYHVEFDAGLRDYTRETAEQTHAMMRSQCTPPAAHGPHCQKCSFREVCVPTLPAESGPGLP